MTIFSDDFGRPDGAPGAGWVLVSGLWVIVSGQLSPGNSGATVVICAAQTMATSDHSAQVTIAATTPVSQGVWCRGTSTLSSGYMLRNDGTSWGLFKIVAGVFTSIGTYAAAAAAGDVARVQAVGSTITGWVNGVARITVTDSSVASGTSTGLRAMSTTGLRFDNFTAADVVTGATLGIASSIETAQPLIGSKGAVLGTVIEVSTAQPVAGAKAATVATAAAVEAAEPLTGIVTAALGTAAAAEAALPLTGTVSAALGPAAEAAAAQALAGTKAAPLPAAAETETAQPLTGRASGTLSAAASVEAAQPLTGTKTAVLGTALETSTAGTLAEATPGRDIDVTVSEPFSRWTAELLASNWTGSLIGQPLSQGGHVSTPQSSASLEWVNAAVGARDAGQPADISTDPVEFAFARRFEEPTTWVTGEWASPTPLPSGAYTARCFVGPGGAIELTPATYNVWVKITDNPEIPVINCGQLIIS